MHAYLIIGSQRSLQNQAIESIVKEKDGVLYPYTVESIADIRSLTNFTKLSAQKNTCILLENIDLISETSTNALLKQIEEPQEKITFILTAKSLHQVISTIVSRCIVVSVGNDTTFDDSESQAFLELSAGEKINQLSKITKREDALSFLENLILTLEKNLSTSSNITSTAALLKSASIAYSRIKKNGNVTLQLVNIISSTHTNK